jgi:hypothetical protein
MGEKEWVMGAEIAMKIKIVEEEKVRICHYIRE